MTNTAREFYALSYRLEREHVRLFWEHVSCENNTPEYGTVARALDGNAKDRHQLADDCFKALHSSDVVNSAYHHLRDREESETHYAPRQECIHRKISAREPGHFLTEMICKQWSGRPSPFNQRHLSVTAGR